MAKVMPNTETNTNSNGQESRIPSSWPRNGDMSLRSLLSSHSSPPSMSTVSPFLPAPSAGLARQSTLAIVEEALETISDDGWYGTRLRRTAIANHRVAHSPQDVHKTCSRSQSWPKQ